jgi:hypothetical protein
MSKKKKKDEELEVKVIGLPSAILLPARRYKFKPEVKHHKIKIPRKGTYKDIDPEAFTEKDGAFDFGKDDTIFMQAVNKVLFATKKYPDLLENQAFALLGLKLMKRSLEIIGTVIEFLEVEDGDGMSEMSEG